MKEEKTKRWISLSRKGVSVLSVFAEEDCPYESS